MAEKLAHETSTSGNEKDVREISSSPERDHDVEVGHQEPAKLSRGLQGRHMQMIAIGNQVSLVKSLRTY